MGSSITSELNVDKDRMEGALNKLKSWRERVNKELETQFKDHIKRAQEVHSEGVQMVEFLREFSMRGGKRIRPALAIAGYKGVGGKEIDRVIPAVTSIEAFQTYVLIHDDVEDEDELRRGEPTMHKMYEKYHEENGLVGDKELFGRNLGITAGALADSYSVDTLTRSDFPPETKMEAIKKLEEIHRYTAIGQALDHTINHMRSENVEEGDTLTVHNLKTAHYTIAGPLELGVILGGGTEKQKQTLKKFGLKAGKAFQVYDDMLGLYGTKEKLGKPVDSDLKEGKKTLLILKALENGNKQQRKKIKQTLGNKNITPEQIEEIRKIVKDTGSYQYSRERVNRLIKEAKDVLKETDNIDEEMKDFLLGIADYIITRKV